LTLLLNERPNKRSRIIHPCARKESKNSALLSPLLESMQSHLDLCAINEGFVILFLEFAL
jgi:hypothetical protein